MINILLGASVKSRLGYMTFMVLSLIFLIVICNSTDSLGFWPFTPKKKDIMAIVGDEIVTKIEFIEEISRLHKSNRAGEALSRESLFAKQDFIKFLNELVDNKLMVIEAINLGLDKEAGFINQRDNYILNLSLERLRQNEIINKIKVDEKEVEDYYQEQLKRKEEEKKKGQEKSAEQKADEEKGDTAKEEIKEAVETQNGSGDSKIGGHKSAAPDEKETIRRNLFNGKVQAREKEYFAYIRQKARVKINNETLNALTHDNTEFFGKEVASVNGEPILGIDVLRNLTRVNIKDEAIRKEALEKLIWYKVLDQEALSRGYEREKEISEKIKRYREQLLINQFKRKAILPAVKVEEKDIMEYYNVNKEKYKLSDKVNLKMIHVLHEREANAIFEELKKGADFAYLAREKSIDPTKEKGGDIGWVMVDQLTDDITHAVAEAKRGDILGPFKVQAGYVIVEFYGYEKGGYIPLENVRNEIDKTIGTERYNATLKTYIEQLRQIIPIEINQAELNRFQGN